MWHNYTCIIVCTILQVSLNCSFCSGHTWVHSFNDNICCIGNMKPSGKGGRMQISLTIAIYRTSFLILWSLKCEQFIFLNIVILTLGRYVNTTPLHKLRLCIQLSDTGCWVNCYLSAEYCLDNDWGIAVLETGQQHTLLHVVCYLFVQGSRDLRTGLYTSPSDSHREICCMDSNTYTCQVCL